MYPNAFRSSKAFSLISFSLLLNLFLFVFIIFSTGSGLGLNGLLFPLLLLKLPLYGEISLFSFLFFSSEYILLAKSNVDYRDISNKDDMIEIFDIKNLDTNDENRNKNV